MLSVSKHARGYLLVVWLALILMGSIFLRPCYAAEGGGHHATEQEPYEQWPNISVGENSTASIGYIWAKFGLSLMKTIGMMVAVWGMLEFGTSVYHHDPSMRTQGVLYVISGVILTLLGKILSEWGIF